MERKKRPSRASTGLSGVLLKRPSAGQVDRAACCGRHEAAPGDDAGSLYEAAAMTPRCRWDIRYAHPAICSAGRENQGTLVVSQDYDPFAETRQFVLGGVNRR